MVVQMQASILARMMVVDCHQNQTEFFDAVQDALIMARESALIPTPQETVSNDRTTLKHQRVAPSKTT